MRWQHVKLERFDMGQRFGRLESRDIGNGCARFQVEEHLGADEGARAAVIEAHFERFRRDEAPAPHDQFRAACFVVAQMGVHERLDHVALALTNLRHVDFNRASQRSELRGVARQMRDLGAANFILAWQTCDVWTGAPDPLALDDRSPSSRSRHVPGGELAPASAAKDKNVVLFGLRHEHPPYMKGPWPSAPPIRASDAATVAKTTGVNRARRPTECGRNQTNLRRKLRPVPGNYDDPHDRNTVTTTVTT